MERGGEKNNWGGGGGNTHDAADQGKGDWRHDSPGQVGAGRSCLGAHLKVDATSHFQCIAKWLIDYLEMTIMLIEMYLKKFFLIVFVWSPQLY